jgi:hypothetical protein
MLCSLANLDGDKLSRIQAWERETGNTVLAFSCSNLEAAQLNAQGLEALQGLENDLGLSLVAVKS